MDDVEMDFAFVAEGYYVGLVACQTFMPKPHTKIVQDGVRRDRALSQVQRVRRQVGPCLSCFAFDPPPFNYAVAVCASAVASFNSILSRPQTNHLGLNR